MYADGWQTIASSSLGQPLRMWVGGSGPAILILGAMHGDETLSGPLISRLLADCRASSALTARIHIIPVVNPDGVSLCTRTNGAGVDLNRNFPTGNWSPEASRPRYHPGPAAASEPETQALVALIERLGPTRILTVHQPLAQNNYDGPAAELAGAMARLNGLPATSDVGYPTPGSFGSWAGRQLGIPVITLELSPGGGLDEAWEAQREALWCFIRWGSGAPR